jgi:hypothetical protein
VLYEEYGEELSPGSVANIVCGAGKTIITRRAPAQLVVDTVGSPIGSWYSSPGCWSPSTGEANK